MKQLTSAQFESEVVGSAQPVVVDFYTDDCSPCRSLTPIIQEWEAESNGAFKVVKIDAASEAGLAASHGVRAVPTLLLYANGKCLSQSVGLKSKASLKKWFDEGLKVTV